MTQQTSDTKTAALDKLYSGITRIVEEMSGKASRSESRRGVPDAMVASPQSEGVPALHVEMPGGFQVDFAPSHPLSVGNALSVRATRGLSGSRKTDWTFIFGRDGWQRTQAPLSDDEIRACLTPEGPPSL